MLSNPSCEQVAMMVHKTRLSIHVLPDVVGMLNFQVQRMDTQRGTGLGDKLNGAGPDALMAPSSNHKKLIDKGVAAMKLQTIAKGQHNISNGLTVSVYQPDAPQTCILNKPCQSCARCVFLERIVVYRIKLLHKRQKKVDIAQSCKLEDWSHGTKSLLFRTQIWSHRR